MKKYSVKIKGSNWTLSASIGEKLSTDSITEARRTVINEKYEAARWRAELPCDKFTYTYLIVDNKTGRTVEAY